MRATMQRVRSEFARHEANGNAWFALAGALTASYVLIEARNHRNARSHQEFASIQIEWANERRRLAKVPCFLVTGDVLCRSCARMKRPLGTRNQRKRAIRPRAGAN